jgi:hypothetical protein
MTHALLLAAMVVIRTYNYAQVPPEQLARARATTERTFQRAAISITWIECRVPADRRSSIVDRPECTRPLHEGSEFMLRLMPPIHATDRGSLRHIEMGSSVIDRTTGGGALATVDSDLVMNIAHDLGAEDSTLLGRAVAHEIGHLLLGHPRHSRDGLMRAIWSQAEIRGLRPAGWQFSAAEAAQMRQGLAGRARAAN